MIRPPKSSARSLSGAKTYDSTTGFSTGQLAVTGAVNGETVTLTQGTGQTASVGAGSYAVSPLSNVAIQVCGGNMMAFNYVLRGSGTLTIGKATINGLSPTCRVAGRGGGVLTGLDSSFGLTSRTGAGQYALAVTGTNYRVVGTMGCTYTIDQRPLTIVADNVARLPGASQYVARLPDRRPGASERRRTHGHAGDKCDTIETGRRLRDHARHAGRHGELCRRLRARYAGDRAEPAGDRDGAGQHGGARLGLRPRPRRDRPAVRRVLPARRGGEGRAFGKPVGGSAGGRPAVDRVVDRRTAE